VLEVHREDGREFGFYNGADSLPVALVVTVAEGRPPVPDLVTSFRRDLIGEGIHVELVDPKVPRACAGAREWVGIPDFNQGIMMGDCSCQQRVDAFTHDRDR